MSSRTSQARLAAILLAVVGSLGSVLAVASPALADSPTTTAFVGETAVTAAFGQSWALSVSVTGDSFGEEAASVTAALGPKDGTLSVTVSGVGGTFSTGIPIQEDGHAYVTQPLGQPLLAAGEYQVTAIFSPASGTRWTTSQTATPASLTITPLGLLPRAEVVSDPTVSAKPYIAASLSGEYVDTWGTPAGVWTFALADGGDAVFSTTVAQVDGATEPLRVPIKEKLRGGRDLTLTTQFTPITEIAGGVEITPAADSRYSTPGDGIVDALTARIAFPTWATLALSALIVALVVAVIVLVIRLAGRGGVAPSASDSSAEIAKPSDAGLVDAELSEPATLETQPLEPDASEQSTTEFVSLETVLAESASTDSDAVEPESPEPDGPDETSR